MLTHLLLDYVYCRDTVKALLKINSFKHLLFIVASSKTQTCNLLESGKQFLLNYSLTNDALGETLIFLLLKLNGPLLLFVVSVF